MCVLFVGVTICVADDHGFVGTTMCCGATIVCGATTCFVLCGDVCFLWERPVFALWGDHCVVGWDHLFCGVTMRVWGDHVVAQ